MVASSFKLIKTLYYTDAFKKIILLSIYKLFFARNSAHVARVHKFCNSAYLYIFYPFLSKKSPINCGLSYYRALRKKFIYTNESSVVVFPTGSPQTFEKKNVWILSKNVNFSLNFQDIFEISFCKYNERNY